MENIEMVQYDQVDSRSEYKNTDPNTILLNLKRKLDNALIRRYGGIVKDHQYTVTPLLGANLLSDLEILNQLDLANSNTTGILKEYNRLFIALKRAHDDAHVIFERVKKPKSNNICVDINRIYTLIRNTYRIIIILFIITIFSIVVIIYHKLKIWL